MFVFLDGVREREGTVNEKHGRLSAGTDVRACRQCSLGETNRCMHIGILCEEGLFSMRSRPRRFIMRYFLTGLYLLKRPLVKRPHHRHPRFMAPFAFCKSITYKNEKYYNS